MRNWGSEKGRGLAREGKAQCHGVRAGKGEEEGKRGSWEMLSKTAGQPGLGDSEVGAQVQGEPAPEWRQRGAARGGGEVTECSG